MLSNELSIKENVHIMIIKISLKFAPNGKIMNMEDWFR